MSRSRLKGVRAGVYTLSANLPQFNQDLERQDPQDGSTRADNGVDGANPLIQKSQQKPLASEATQENAEENGFPLSNVKKISNSYLDLKSHQSNEMPQFDNYKTTHKVADGGMGSIYRAIEILPSGEKRWVAIKTLHQSLLDEGSPPIQLVPSTDPTKVPEPFAPSQTFKKAIQNLHREFQIASQIRHPNVVKVFKFNQDKVTAPYQLGLDASLGSTSQPFLAMEWLAGKSLKDVLNKTDQLSKRLSQELCAAMIREIALGVGAIHQVNTIHRDVTPQNLMLTYEGGVKIIDFGISKKTLEGTGLKELTQEVTRSEVIKGKPSYISPEQIEGIAVDQRTDIFTLGIVFWELLTGRKLFQGDSFLAIAHRIMECDRFVRPPSRVSQRINPIWDRIIMKCLRKDAIARYQSMEQLASDIFSVLESIQSPVKNGAMFATSLRDLMETLFEREMIDELRSIGQIHLLSQRDPKSHKLSDGNKVQSLMQESYMIAAPPHNSGSPQQNAPSEERVELDLSTAFGKDGSRFQSDNMGVNAIEGPARFSNEVVWDKFRSPSSDGLQHSSMRNPLEGSMGLKKSTTTAVWSNIKFLFATLILVAAVAGVLFSQELMIYLNR